MLVGGIGVSVGGIGVFVGDISTTSREKLPYSVELQLSQIM